MSEKRCLFTLATENFVFNSEGVINRFTTHLGSGDGVFAQKVKFAWPMFVETMHN